MTAGQGHAQMMTVPEQFLLLTLDTETGEFLKLPEAYNSAAFAGAALMELALAGRIDSDLDRVWVVDPAVTGDAALDPVLSAMSAAGAPSSTRPSTATMARSPPATTASSY